LDQERAKAILDGEQPRVLEGYPHVEDLVGVEE
jgi:hypothetical protein